MLLTARPTINKTAGLHHGQLNAICNYKIPMLHYMQCLVATGILDYSNSDLRCSNLPAASAK